MNNAWEFKIKKDLTSQAYLSLLQFTPQFPSTVQYSGIRGLELI